MIRLYYIPEYTQIKVEDFSQEISEDNLIWVDLQDSDQNERSFIENKFKINFPSRQQQEEIETSSRYTEEHDRVLINSTFLTYNYSTRNIDENQITFIITEKYPFDIRDFESKVLAETVRRLKDGTLTSKNPEDILVNIIENRIDLDADLIESISKNIALLNQQMNSNKNPNETIILEINKFQQQIMIVREALFDKQRVVSSLLRNNKTVWANKDDLRTVLKDINSLIEHTNFNFTRLEYMQNNFLGLTNLEQNKVIKLFTVATVVFMPPTLIASIYGMNFKVMPELEWLLGYPFAIFLMIFSSAITLYYFKRKKWL